MTAASALISQSQHHPTKYGQKNLLIYALKLPSKFRIRKITVRHGIDSKSLHYEQKRFVNLSNSSIHATAPLFYNNIKQSGVFCHLNISCPANNNTNTPRTVPTENTRQHRHHFSVSDHHRHTLSWAVGYTHVVAGRTADNSRVVVVVDRALRTVLDMDVLSMAVVGLVDTVQIQLLHLVVAVERLGCTAEGLLDSSLCFYMAV